MNPRFRPLFVVSAVLSLAGCDKPTPTAAGVPPAAAPAVAEPDPQLAEARDALQRQALEIETKTALMDKQLAEMEQALKARENAELRGSLDALKQQNEALRVQAETAREKSNVITQRIAATPALNAAPQPVVARDYSLFYEGLAPYGRWFDVNGYGYCWRPTITVAGWRPYLDGCWVWSSLGWAWQSNEPFGWATYHYGRWVNLASYGWVWVPGSEWAPAWVAWRQSRDCVGWAPLPPEPGVCNGVYRDCDAYYGLGPTSYVFINLNQFVSPTYINMYAPVTQRTTIFQHSVNVTQIVPSSGQSHGRGHGHVFAQQGGPPRAQIEQACGHQVPQRPLQTMHADQVPNHRQRGHQGPPSAVAMVELPAMAPGAHVMRPPVKEHIQHPAPMSGFEGVPQNVATEIRQNIAQEREAAVVQHPPAQHGRMPHEPGRQHPAGAPGFGGRTPGVVGTAPAVNVPAQETVRPAVAVESPPPAQTGMPVVTVPGLPSRPLSAGNGEQTRPARPAAGGTPAEHNRGEHSRQPVVAQPTIVPQPPVMPAGGEQKAGEAPAVAAPVVTPGQPGTQSQTLGVPVPGVAQQPAGTDRMAAGQANANAAAEAERKGRVHAAGEQVPAAIQLQRRQMELEEQAMAFKRSTEQAAAAAEAEKTRMQAAAAQQQQEAQAAQQQQRMGAEQAAAEAEKVRQQAAANAMQLSQQQETLARALAEKMAADQAAVTAEAEKARMQAAASVQQQQEAFAAQQQRMAAEQAAAENEKARRLAEAAAMQQQQELAVQQQRAAAERMASEQAAAEAARAQQAQAAAAMQRQQEEAAARRAAEEQQMRAQQEAAQRAAQEQAQRQAEEQARRQQEAEMQRAQEQARRAAEEQMRAQQEAAQRAALEQQMRAQQEAAQRALEQMRAQQEAAQRAAQEQAQRQAEEAARRAQEEAQRAAAEAAQRAAEAARNQPQPAPGS
jgi:hypothetical protein